MKLRWSLALAAGALLGGCHKKAEPPPPHGKRPTLQIAATGDVWGQVEPCG